MLTLFAKGDVWFVYMTEKGALPPHEAEGYILSEEVFELHIFTDYDEATYFYNTWKEA